MAVLATALEVGPNDLATKVDVPATDGHDVGAPTTKATPGTLVLSSPTVAAATPVTDATDGHTTKRPYPTTRHGATVQAAIATVGPAIAVATLGEVDDDVVEVPPRPSDRPSNAVTVPAVLVRPEGPTVPTRATVGNADAETRPATTTTSP